MPKLIYSAIASVDGYVADRDRNLGAAGQRLREVIAGRETRAMRPRQSPATLDFARSADSLPAAAFRAGLGDELRLLVAPVVVGSDCPLDLLSVRRFDSGFVHLRYAVAR